VQIIAKKQKWFWAGINGEIKNRIVAHVQMKLVKMGAHLVFKSIQWVQREIANRWSFFIFWKPALFGRKWSIAHPEMEPVTVANEANEIIFKPVYLTTEKLRNRIFWILVYFQDHWKLCRKSCLISRDDSRCNRKQYQLIRSSRKAINKSIFPSEAQPLQRARKRLKFKSFF